MFSRLIRNEKKRQIRRALCGWSVWCGRRGFCIEMPFIVVILVDAADEAPVDIRTFSSYRAIPKQAVEVRRTNLRKL
jgi:hypothetical protein